jgi:hypothetical protein
MEFGKGLPRFKDPGMRDFRAWKRSWSNFMMIRKQNR